MADNYITIAEEKGSIHISEEVIGSIVRSSILEVEGVAGLANTAGADLAELIGIKTISKGVKVSFDDMKIFVDAIITVSYGCNIVEVANRVQANISAALQSMTGVNDTEVNVHVSGIAF